MREQAKALAFVPLSSPKQRIKPARAPGWFARLSRILPAEGETKRANMPDVRCATEHAPQHTSLAIPLSKQMPVGVQRSLVFLSLCRNAPSRQDRRTTVETRWLSSASMTSGLFNRSSGLICLPRQQRTPSYHTKQSGSIGWPPIPHDKSSQRSKSAQIGQEYDIVSVLPDVAALCISHPSLVRRGILAQKRHADPPCRRQNPRPKMSVVSRGITSSHQEARPTKALRPV
jgi:hypothetical protein